ncbi:30S ribosomal protein S3 [Candidatus Peregrinibacteria bacterium]|nr:MAG: 30S ribosomal protein S3 [Candidatus Peregrinibacteria bacterium]
MGQKVNPKSFRIGFSRTWDSKWYAGPKNFAKTLLEDMAIRKEINERLKNAAVTTIEVERSANRIIIQVYAGKPGMVIGKGGAMIEDLKDALRKKFNRSIDVNIHEVTHPELSAELVGRNIAAQIERRIAYRRALKASLQKALESGAKGVKIQISGRLNGVEIARREHFKEGNIPLHTLRADIDYASVIANTSYGVIGIKVWIYKGMIFKKKGEVAA